jgi:hypothetical protein
MNGGTTKEQLLTQFVGMHRGIEKKVEEQQRFIEQLQLLMEHEGLFIKMIGGLSLSAAVFESGVVRVVNNLLTAEASIKARHVVTRKL